MQLNEKDHSRIYKFYKDALDRFGDSDVRSVQWTSLFGQKKRFEVLLNVDNVSGSSLLDVGCGLGDLYAFSKERDVNIDYTGIDIVEDFVKTAQTKFPEANFRYSDIFEVEEEFDYVVASGAMSFKVADNDNHYREMIKKMYSLANKAVAFNMLDKLTHVDNETYAAYHPGEIADFCSTFAGRVEMVTDYLPQDFTVYLYK